MGKKADGLRNLTDKVLAEIPKKERDVLSQVRENLGFRKYCQRKYGIFWDSEEYFVMEFSRRVCPGLLSRVFQKEIGEDAEDFIDREIELMGLKETEEMHRLINLSIEDYYKRGFGGCKYSLSKSQFADEKVIAYLLVSQTRRTEVDYAS